MSYLERPFGIVQDSKRKFAQRQKQKDSTKKFDKLNLDAGKTVSLQRFA